MAVARFHNDEPVLADALGRDQYASTFAEMIVSCDTPSVVGIYGTWGSGKSSLMRQIQEKLSIDTTKAAWFDPWKYQFSDNLILVLMHLIAKEFGVDKQATVRKSLRRLGRCLLLSAGARISGSSIADIVTALEEPVDDMELQLRDDQLSIREQFETVVREAQGDPPKRLVIFIDDLDRCMPPVIMSVLENLKLFLNLDGCVFVLGLDRRPVEAAIAIQYSSGAVAHADYLDKIVQIPFTIPPIRPESMSDFVTPLLDSDLQACRGVLVDCLGDNPRQVKRFVNILRFNHLLAKQAPWQATDYDPVMLATILLIQYRARDLYDELVEDPGLLLRLHEASASGNIDEEAGRWVSSDRKLATALARAPVRADTPVADYLFVTDVVSVEPESDESLATPPTGIRVHELAKELGLANKETLDLCLALGIGVKTHSSRVDAAQADRVRRKVERDNLVRPEQSFRSSPLPSRSQIVSPTGIRPPLPTTGDVTDAALSGSRLTSRLKWFSEEQNYGFIELDGSSDLFVHGSGLDCPAYQLWDGRLVSFAVTQTERGPQAIGVQLVGEG